MKRIVLNETLTNVTNYTVAAPSVIDSVKETVFTSFFTVITYFKTIVIPRILDLVIAPIKAPDMLWIVFPLLIALISMQLYFGRHKAEELGWNTAYGNSIALLFVSINLLKYIYSTQGAGVGVKEFFHYTVLVSYSFKVLIVVFILAQSFLLLFLNFFHWLPKRLAFFISSSIPMNITAYIAIVLVYSDNIPLDIHTLVAGICMFFIVLLFFKIFRFLVPTSKESKKIIYTQKIHKLNERIRHLTEKIGSGEIKGPPAPGDSKTEIYKVPDKPEKNV